MAVVVSGRPPAGVSAAAVRNVAERAMAALDLEPAQLSIRFAGDSTSRSFNRRYRGVDRPTDVLSFAAEAGSEPVRVLGDLLISRDRASIQARAGGLTARREVEELVLHGILHLIGHDHEVPGDPMDAIELRLRRRLLDGNAGTAGRGKR